MTAEEVEAYAKEVSAKIGKAKWTDISAGLRFHAGVQALAAAPGLPLLHTLDLGFNSIGDAGMQALATAPGLPALSAVGLAGNEIGAVMRRALEHPEFRQRLMDNPQEALTAHGFALEQSDLAEIDWHARRPIATIVAVM